jgi:hypothetical protein
VAAEKQAERASDAQRVYGGRRSSGRCRWFAAAWLVLMVKGGDGDRLITTVAAHCLFIRVIVGGPGAPPRGGLYSV